MLLLHKEKNIKTQGHAHINYACSNPAILIHTAVSAGGASQYPCVPLSQSHFFRGVQEQTVQDL